MFEKTLATSYKIQNFNFDFYGFNYCKSQYKTALLNTYKVGQPGKLRYLYVRKRRKTTFVLFWGHHKFQEYITAQQKAV